jgi:hypothetical protein
MKLPSLSPYTAEEGLTHGIVRILLRLSDRVIAAPVKIVNGAVSLDIQWINPSTLVDIAFQIGGSFFQVNANGINLPHSFDVGDNFTFALTVISEEASDRLILNPGEAFC